MGFKWGMTVLPIWAPICISFCEIKCQNTYRDPAWNCWTLCRFTLSAIAYSILILITFLGNSLVIWAVARRKELWNPRNIFILNLAISDICKCTNGYCRPVSIPIPKESWFWFLGSFQQFIWNRNRNWDLKGIRQGIFFWFTYHQQADRIAIHDSSLCGIWHSSSLLPICI